MKKAALFTGVVVLAIVVVIYLLLSWVLLIAWNGVIPFVFGLPELDFPQAFAVFLLISVTGLALRPFPVANSK